MRIHRLEAGMGTGQAAAGGLSAGERVKLRRACHDLEAGFAKQLVSAARQAAEGESLFGQEAGSDLVRDMHDEALSQALADSGSLGLARLVYDQLVRAAGRQAGHMASPGTRGPQRP